jgi:hypothetical protein
VCAEKLTGDLTGPRGREDELRKRARRFSTWLTSDRWIFNANEHRRPGRGFHFDYELVVHLATDGWRWKCVVPTMATYPSTFSFGTAEAAKKQFWLKHVEKA